MSIPRKKINKYILFTDEIYFAPFVLSCFSKALPIGLNSLLEKKIHLTSGFNRLGKRLEVIV